jgi:hypothetical protein
MTPPVHAARSRQHSRATWLRAKVGPRIAVITITATLAGGTGALAASLLAPLAASASSSQQWTGKGDGSKWSNPQNWASNKVPQNGDSVTISPTATESAPNVSGMPAGMQLQNLTLVDSSLSGGGVTVAGNFSWNASLTSSTLAAPLTVEGDASFSGTGRENSQDPMTFDGTAEIKGPGVLLIQDSGPAVTNNGTLTLSPGATMQAGACCVTPDEFLNTGTVSMSTAGTATVTGMGFDGQGAVSVGKGSLLDVTAGVGEFGPGAGISGGGTLQFDLGAHQTLATGVSVAAGSTLTLAGNAELFGPGTFVGGGKFSWTGGTIDGSLNVAKTIHTTISGTATKTLTSPTTAPTALTLHGATSVAGSGEVQLSGTTTLSNTGTLTMKTGTMIGGSSCCVSPDNFSNSGTLVVAAGAGTATTNFLQFSNSGAVKVNSGTLTIGALPYKQTAGSTQLAGGSISAAQQMNIAAGTLSGFGTITGSVLNGGTVAPGTTGGVLKITGAYQQTSSGTLSSVITGTTPGTKFGQLSVGGTATLAGTLKASTGNGFVPAHGASVSVLLYHTRSGMFGTLSGSPPYTVSYTATAANVVYP